MPAPAAMPDIVRTGPLALAALDYWRRCEAARVGLWSLGYFRHLTAEARTTLLSSAVEGAEGLTDIARSGHPKIRDRARLALPTIIPRITAFVEPR